jgi:hypothetical protein
LLALDAGQGMLDWARCVKDGYSTAGSPGTGLGAIMRASSVVDVYSQPGRGTGVFARVADRTWQPASAPDGLAIGAVSVPYPGEVECGDAWAVMSTPAVLRLLVVDGLGHGILAAEAARAAVQAFAAGRNDTPAAAISRIHEQTRSTRGAAAAVAELDVAAGVVRFCGVGNIVGLVASAEGERRMVTHNGTLGHEARRVQVFSYPLPRESMLLLHSDGLATHWQGADYPGLFSRHPALVAGLLYRDVRRQRDDVTVVVVGPHRNVIPQERNSQ